MDRRDTVRPPPTPPPALTPAPRAAGPRCLPGQLLLLYTPDGPVGGSFTCTGCGAQAWQPELLAHAPGCPFQPAAPVTPR